MHRPSDYLNMPPRVISTSLDLATDPDTSGQEALFEKVAAEFAAPLARLARAHEADAHQQQDLLQEIHIALWRSLAAFGERCSLRTARRRARRFAESRDTFLKQETAAG